MTVRATLCLYQKRIKKETNKKKAIRNGGVEPSPMDNHNSKKINNNKDLFGSNLLFRRHYMYSWGAGLSVTFSIHTR